MPDDDWALSNGTVEFRQEAHPEFRFDPDNLITLCRPCHNEAHRKEVTPV